MNKVLLSSRAGFTLIELLVVISIIGMLASVILVSVQAVRTKGLIASMQEFDQHTHTAFYSDIVTSLNFDSTQTLDSGTFAPDDSGNNNFLGLSGAYETNTPNPFSTGNVLSVDFTSGKTTGGTTLHNPPTGDFSVSFWVYPTNSTAGNYVDTNWNGGITPGAGGAWEVGSDSNGLEFFYANTTVNTVHVTGPVLTPNAWSQIVAVCSNTQIGLYVNGKFYAKSPLGGSYTCTNTNTSATIGQSYVIYGNTLSGTGTTYPYYMDNLRIYRNALPL